MGNNPKRQLVVEPVPSSSPEIGRWLWVLGDTRRRTLGALEGLGDDAREVLDWVSPASGNSIGTILYHLAAVEASWLYEEVLQEEFPPEVVELLPYDMRDSGGHLMNVRGIPLQAHLDRLEKIRSKLLSTYTGMSLEDYIRPRQLPDYTVSPEWVLHHLMQHEGEHRGQIMELRLLVEIY